MRYLLFLMLALGLGACATNPSMNNGSDSYAQGGYHESAPVARDPAADMDVNVIRENGPRVNLEKCGGRDGQAVMRREYGQLFLYITNMDCAYYKTAFMTDEDKLDGSQNNFGKRIPVNEDVPGWHELIIGSKAYFNHPQPGSKADVLRFYVPARVVSVNLYDGREPQKSIPYCGGTVEGRIQNGSVNLIFRGVDNCTFMEISNNGERKVYDLQPQSGGYGGSFNVPRAMVQSGANQVNIRLWGARKEARIQAQFLGASF